MAEYVWWTLDVTGESACSWYNSLMETNKFAMSVKIKTTSELNLNESPVASLIKHLVLLSYQVNSLRSGHTNHD